MFFHNTKKKLLGWGCGWILTWPFFPRIMENFDMIWHTVVIVGETLWNESSIINQLEANQSAWGQYCLESSGRCIYAGPETMLLEGFHTHPTMCTSEELCEIARNIVWAPFTDTETEAQKATWYAPNWLVAGTELNPKSSTLKNLIMSSYTGFSLLIPI